MRNNIYKSMMAIGCLAMALTSCSDFLEEDNKSSISSENYFNKEEGYESLITAGYASLKNIYNERPYLFCLGTDLYNRGESEARNGSYEGKDIAARGLNEYADLDAENGFVNTFYSQLYKSVQVCNTAIARAAASGLSEANQKQKVAEMKVLRAYYYYLLVEHFGDVALVLDETTSPITHFEREPEEKVYEFIISELDEAAANLPAVPSEFGKVTSGAAKHLEALVYLTRGYKSYGQTSDFQKAATLADAVINSGQYQLIPSFEELWDYNNLQNKEIIFSVQYDSKTLDNGTKGNCQSNCFGFDAWNKVNGGFDYGNLAFGYHQPQFTPSQFLFSLFNTDIDSRYDVTFKSEYYATADAPNVGVKKGDLRVYFPKYDHPLSKEDSLALQAANPHAIIVPRELWKPDIDNTGGCGMTPMIWKFHDPNMAFAVDGCSRDIVLFRLGETYLIAAEAYLKSGDKEKAAERINTIRQRAAKPGHEAEMLITANDVDIDFILDERGREMAGEYKRWMDLKRTGKLVERTLKHNILARRANGLKEYHNLRPIPQTVIDQDSGTFPQNEGYK